jgi:serine/threonine-protein kinase
MPLDDRVLDLLGRYEELLGQGQHVTPEELCRDCPDLITEVRRRIEGLRALNPLFSTPEEVADSIPTRDTSVDTQVEQVRWDPAGHRYRPIRFHARGGLGEVFIAQDAELGREVALKRIKERYQGDSSNRREFLREAEITARLEHPGVVPVHGLVQDEAGEPCYAMRFIQGESLDKPIERFHEADKNPKRDPGERSLSLRELLNRFIAVCNTIAYAHSRGVLHRDLKPQNIMLGKFGETLVVDWGLAKSFERSDEARSTGEETVRPSVTPEEGHETRPGDVKGTPAYMSPEQASGRIDEIGPASDIFALGATLYAVLTGVAPYRGEKALSKASRAQFTPPRQIKPQLPRRLEAICLKAMALMPDDRYPTAKALADELEKWQADEPVTAYRDSRWERAGRWLRRHRVLMTSAAATLVLALVGSTVGLFWLAAAEETERGLRQTAQEREQEARDEKSKAVASQKQAMDALRSTTDEVIERLIGAKPALSHVEKEFLENALTRWQVFATERGESEQARAVRAEGAGRVAHLRHMLVQNGDALSGYQETIDLCERLVSDFPNAPQYQLLLARTHNSLGILLEDLGKRPEAEASYRRALGIQEKLVTDFPTEPQYRYELATSHSNLGALLTGWHQRPEEAHASYRRALTIQEKLVADFPTEHLYRERLATSHNNLGALFGILGKPSEAEASYRRSLSIKEKLVADVPTVPEYRADLADSYYNLGILFAGLGKRSEAEASYRQAMGIQEKLAADFPTVPMYRQGLARSHNNLGALLADEGKRAEAEASYRRSLTIKEKLVADFPTVPQYYIELGGGQVNFGKLLWSRKEIDESLEWYARAITTLETVIRRVEVDVIAQQFLRNAYWNRALAYDDLKRHAEAAADWEKAIELSPESQRPRVRIDRAISRAKAGKADAAIKEAVELAENANALTLYNAAFVFALAADRRDEPGGSLSKEECAMRAVALLQQAVAKGWKNAAHMKKDDDLKALRERPDFKKLVAELEANDQKNKK